MVQLVRQERQEVLEQLVRKVLLVQWDLLVLPEVLELVAVAELLLKLLMVHKADAQMVELNLLQLMARLLTHVMGAVAVTEVLLLVELE
jgi:hypothetical protein